MLTDSKYALISKGDYVAAAEAELDAEADLRSRCGSAYEVFSEGIFPLEVALAGYKISPKQFLGYVLMTYPDVKISVDTTTIEVMANVFVNSVKPVDAKSHRIWTSLEKLTMAI